MNQDPKRRALGRGLDALLPSAPKAAAPVGYADKSVFVCPVEKLAPQKGQPRQHFDEQELEDLTQSIREHGLLEPIVVRRAPAVGGATGDRFEIIAGERRWRASQRAGLREVLVVVKDVSPKDAFELALVENVQRADLNPIELAEAYDRLLREHAYTVESLATRLGKDRSTIANAVRLLKLPARIRTMVIARELTEGHARALLGAPNETSMAQIAEKVAHGKLPVRVVEALVRAARKKAEGATDEKSGPPTKSAGVRDLETRISRRLGTKAEVRDKKGKGEIAIAYGSLDELDRLIALFGA